MAKMRLLNERTQAEQEVCKNCGSCFPILTACRHETQMHKHTKAKSPPNVNEPSRNANDVKPKPKQNQNAHKPYNPTLINSENNTVSESSSCWNRRVVWTCRMIGLRTM
jgi:hypothetical protein